MDRDWHEFEYFGRLLESQRWIFAKTMARTNPHHYTLKDQWNADADFDSAVAFILDNGYSRTFGNRIYTYLNINENFYWAMSEPGVATLINRKRRSEAHPYDCIASRYDALYSDPESVGQNFEVFEMLGDISGRSILDVGCGTGLLLQYDRVGHNYVGIDPSREMIQALRQKYPGRRALNTSLADFVGGRYDLVACLFGSANYLSDEELRRIPGLLNPGGSLFVMFGASGYAPRIASMIDNSAYVPGSRVSTFDNFAIHERRLDSYQIAIGRKEECES
jgi:SAM-dependent methyltransferase